MAAKSVLQVYGEIVDARNSNSFFLASVPGGDVQAATVLSVGHGCFDTFKDQLRQHDDKVILAVFRVVALYIQDNVPSRRVHPILISVIGRGVSAVAKANSQRVVTKFASMLPRGGVAMSLQDVDVDTLGHKSVSHVLFEEVEGALKPVHYDFSGASVVRMNQPPTEAPQWPHLIKF